MSPILSYFCGPCGIRTHSIRLSENRWSTCCLTGHAQWDINMICTDERSIYASCRCNPLLSPQCVHTLDFVPLPGIGPDPRLYKCPAVKPFGPSGVALMGLEPILYTTSVCFLYQIGIERHIVSAPSFLADIGEIATLVPMPREVPTYCVAILGLEPRACGVLNPAGLPIA